MINKITNKFKKELLDKRFILIGEVHGARENIVIVKNVIDFFIKQKISLVLALEWPKNLTNEINKYLTGKSRLNWRSWTFSRTPDGRISRQHLLLLKWLRNKKIKISCFDEGGTDWNDRDKKMAKNILKMSKDNRGAKILVVMGNLHSRLKKFKLDGKEFNVPIGYYLPPDKTFSICLRYYSGKIFNMGVKSIKRKTPTKEYYNHEIIVKKVHPVNPLYFKE